MLHCQAWSLNTPAPRDGRWQPRAFAHEGWTDDEGVGQPRHL